MIEMTTNDHSKQTSFKVIDSEKNSNKTFSENDNTINNEDK